MEFPGRRGFPEEFESGILSGDNLSREIGRTVSSHDFNSLNVKLRVSNPGSIAYSRAFPGTAGESNNPHLGLINPLR